MIINGVIYSGYVFYPVMYLGLSAPRYATAQSSKNDAITISHKVVIRKNEESIKLSIKGGNGKVQTEFIFNEEVNEVGKIY